LPKEVQPIKSSQLVNSVQAVSSTHPFSNQPVNNQPVNNQPANNQSVNNQSVNNTQPIKIT